MTLNISTYFIFKVMKLIYGLFINKYNLNNNKKRSMYKCNNKNQTLRTVMAEYWNSVERLRHSII